jgi:hypothetical protein
MICGETEVVVALEQQPQEIDFTNRMPWDKFLDAQAQRPSQASMQSS